METKDPIEEPGFWCNRATVYFVYSFSLQMKNRRKRPLSRSKGPEEHQSYVVDPKEVAHVIESSLTAKVGIPRSRRGISPHIEFEPDCSYVDYPPTKADLGFENDMEVELGKLVRVFRTAATCTIRVTIASSSRRHVTVEHILQVLRLVSQLGVKPRKSQPLLKVEGRSYKGVYQVFHDTVEDLSSRSGGTVVWFEKRATYIRQAEEVQSPFVVTVAEVGREVARVFCEGGLVESEDPARWKGLRIRRYEPYIAPILYRTLGSADRENWLRLEPAYVDSPTAAGIPGLFNHFIDQRFYGHFTRRSILCICRDITQPPASYLLPDTLNICELVRSRWHMLIMMNKELDDTLKGMREDAIKHMKGLMPVDREAQVNTLIRLRHWLSSCYEDPGIYQIAGDATSRLYEHMQVALRLSELRDNVEGKLRLVDRLAKDIQEHEWIRVSPAHRRMRKKDH